MKKIGFNFTKLHAEKSEKSAENININTNIDVSDVHEVKSDFLSSKDSLVGVKFKYSINYEPEFAAVELNGMVLFSMDKKEATDIIGKWKSKELPESFKLTLFNVILKKSNLKSLHLEEELNLPLHIPMPSVKPEQKK